MGNFNEDNDKEVKRAKEITDAFGYILGSAEYFRHINEMSVWGFLTSRKESNDYYMMIKGSNDKISGCVYEILNDLKNNRFYLSFIKSTDRDKLKCFISGLRNFSGWIGYPCSDCDKCKTYLDLGSDSKRLSRASESEIDKAVYVMYNGGKSNIYSADRLSLIEKAYKSGINWAAGNDINKKKYINEVMGKFDQKFLGDVYHKYMFKYKLHDKLVGKNYKNIFSDDYIKYYEKKIFGIELSFHYMNSGTFNYMLFFKEKMLWIINKFNSDFDRSARGSHFVKFDNFNRIKIAALSLKKLGADITYVLLNLKRFETIDVTDKLMNIFREAKRDGEALRAKYPLAIPNITRFAQFMSLLEIESRKKDNTIRNRYSDIAESYKIIKQTLKLFLDFKKLVQSWGPYDIKRRCSWIRDLQYIFDGRVIDFDDTGNMAYGVIARASGISDFISEWGAGIVNYFENVGILKYPLDYYTDDEIDEIIKTGPKAILQEIKRIRTKFDDPRDSKAIKRGFAYYKKL
ncbi:MAG: polymorphic toxin type 44 domain-containing protein [Clostridia bacterium]|jgi:hypothetical protein|nr:polymorphic toxin type 44 domain-containing protein [Clostridia bacterium]